MPALVQFDHPSSEPALITQGGEVSWPKLHDMVNRAAAELQPLAGRRVGFTFSPQPVAIARWLALASLDCHLFLLADDVSPDTLDLLAVRFQWSAVVSSRPARHADWREYEPAATSAPATVDAVTILTSGTTGTPKAVEHAWAGLARPVRRGVDQQGGRWLLTFRPHLYAGLQVMLQCLLNQGVLVLPTPGASASDVAALAADARVAFASATPSYWRWLITWAQHETLASIPLRQITLGGEAVDQTVLDNLGRVFPHARLVHIYATTELGRCFSVTDRQAGFPAAYLPGPSSDGVELRIEDDELWVRSRNAMRGYDGVASASPHDWFPTGDLVSRQGDRVYFVGRRSDVINVGGNKVHPVEVEQVVRRVSGVADARVYGKSSSLVGQLVACDLVVAAGFDEAAVQQAVRDAAAAELTAFQRPRWLSVVDEIPLTSAGKACRE